MPFGVAPKSKASVAGLCAATATFTLVLIPDADARTRRSNARKVIEVSAIPAVAAPAVTLARAAPIETPAARSPAKDRTVTPLVAAVSLRAQTVTIYSGADVVARSPISSGMSGYATPTGVFSIIQKNKYHESNIYDNAPMPFMQRLTWSGVAFHAGKLPGYPASHGCVRLPYDFADRLFGMLKMGTRVVVAPEVVAPQPIVHASLPQPIYTAVPMIAYGPAAPPLASGFLTLASVAPSTSSDVVTEQQLSPPQWAEHEKRRAQSALAAAQLEARQSLDAAKAAAMAADEGRDDRLRVERELASFRTLLERARSQRDKAPDDEARVQAEASAAAFEDAIADATAAAARLVEVEAALRARSFGDARVARLSEDAVEAADAALRVASRGAEPITVFVSRAERRVQVRQGFHTILEGDVDIRDAHVPLGTHVLTAGAIRDRTNGLAWTGVSISDGHVRGATAAEALSRITLDREIADAIGRRTWSGATMLISDQPASKETGKGTDFVILTK